MPRRGFGSLPSAIKRVSARPISSMLATPDWLSLAENFSSWRWLVSTISGSDGSLPGIRASTIAVFFSGRTDDATTMCARSGTDAFAPELPHRSETWPRSWSASALPWRAERMNAKVVFSP